ncbi:MAG: FtsW/RodA/SpoVE family cell cycle protein [Clostridia bacterium]|nr:FtsW/RodA/SpoVE family cell cycle protein [Clostridia bacterium]MBR2413216.1 FtsW/RodA/SpoVE family cell cycle protein [Clostridia bacterium]MBR3954034.1 FtsW/RodA/SpoVE family cell cycle protein [Clostridia bacterium]
MSQSVKRKESDFRRIVRLLTVNGAPDVMFFALVLILVTVGLIAMYSASYPYAYANRGGDSFFYVKRQVIYCIAGVFVMLAVSKLKYQRMQYLGAIGGFALSMLLLILVLLMPSEDGSIRRRMVVFGIEFQPSEVAKFCLILICAYLLAKYYKDLIGKEPLQYQWAKRVNAVARMPLMNRSLIPILLCGGCTVIFAGLVFLESHLSGAIIMAIIGLGMLWFGGTRKKWFVIGIILVVVAAYILYNYTDFFRDYMMERIELWKDKDADPLGGRWQTNQALYAIGSGGFFGTGLGGSKQKHLYVSEPQNDMIFAIFCEENGVIGAFILILLFALLIWRGIVIAVNAKDHYGMLVVLGIMLQVGSQVFLNLCVATDTLPNTGVSLPFFSYGGTSLLMLMGEMGIVLSISRQSNLKRATETAKAPVNKKTTEETA